MINILFEDTEGTDTAKLLRLGCSLLGYTAHFVGGFGNFYRYILDNKLEDTCVVVHDLVPDNQSIIRGYRTTKKRLRHRDNIYYVPIPCLEFQLLRAFICKDPASPSKVISSINYRILNSSITSAEKFYKYALDRQKDCYTLGSFSEVTNYTGLFYRKSCECDDCDTRLCLITKARLLIETYNFCKYKDLIKLQNEAIDRYNSEVKLVAEKLNWPETSLLRALI